MGNRGFIRGKDSNGCGVYLHWNGGLDSVVNFLEYCKLKGYRGFGEDDGYACARLVQVIANWFGGALSVGVYPNYMEDIGCDNGSFIVEGWDIVARKYPYEGYEDEDVEVNSDFLLEIDRKQPESEQIVIH